MQYCNDELSKVFTMDSSNQELKMKIKKLEQSMLSLHQKLVAENELVNKDTTTSSTKEINPTSMFLEGSHSEYKKQQIQTGVDASGDYIPTNLGSKAIYDIEKHKYEIMTNKAQFLHPKTQSKFLLFDKNSKDMPNIEYFVKKLKEYDKNEINNISEESEVPHKLIASVTSDAPFKPLFGLSIIPEGLQTDPVSLIRQNTPSSNNNLLITTPSTSRESKYQMEKSTSYLGASQINYSQTKPLYDSLWCEPNFTKSFPTNDQNPYVSYSTDMSPRYNLAETSQQYNGSYFTKNKGLLVSEQFSPQKWNNSTSNYLPNHKFIQSYEQRLQHLDIMCKQEMERVKSTSQDLGSLNQVVNDWKIESIERQNLSEDNSMEIFDEVSKKDDLLEGFLSDSEEEEEYKEPSFNEISREMKKLEDLVTCVKDLKIPDLLDIEV